MPSMQRPYRKTLPCTLAAGDGTVSFNHNTLKLLPYLIGTFNIVAKGLDGGSFTVAGVCGDDVSRALDATTYTESKIAAYDDKYILEGIVVTLAGCGAGAAPEVTLVAFGRNYRFETGV